MDTHGATTLSKEPKWVMCAVCGEVIYGGPGFHPIPRECGCKATRVVPRENRGYVQWDAEAYAKAAEEVFVRDALKNILARANAAADKAEKRGANELDVKLAYTTEREQAEKEELSPEKKQAFIASFPTEPEVEYIKEGEVLTPVIPVAPPTSIDDVYKAHMRNIEQGKEP